MILHGRDALFGGMNDCPEPIEGRFRPITRFDPSASYKMKVDSKDRECN